MWIIAQWRTTFLVCAADGLKRDKIKRSWIAAWNKLMLAVTSSKLLSVGYVRLTVLLGGITKILSILLLEKGLSGDMQCE
jgi:hypothetical protein